MDPLPELFHYKEIMKNKKRMVQYEINPQGSVVSSSIITDGSPDIDWEDAAQRGNGVYEILETGGFLKLYRKPHARWYWHLQACAHHLVPDWKIHFSIAEEDIGKAWDAACSVFISMGCLSGLKIQTQGEAWPAYQRGRELTVYLYRHSPAFAQHEDETVSARKEWEQPEEFWLEMIARIEASLARLGVHSRGGAADGDLPIGPYASLRNEAFVRAQPSWALPQGWSGVDLGQEGAMLVYPPNCAGHNAAGHSCPLRRYHQRSRVLDCIAAAAALVLAWLLQRWLFEKKAI